MRTDIDHLPAAKQRELERVVQILFEEFEQATAIATADWKKRARILKVILYGSYARGGWVDEPHTAKGYKSDFDLLIIVNHPKLTDRAEFWSSAEERLNRELAVTGNLKTPVNFIVHALQEVNDGLAQGRYFFMDIARDGIALYQNDDSNLPEPTPKTPEQAVAMAREYFEEWLPSGHGRVKLAKYAMQEGLLKQAAFEFHQAAESYYHCVLLVCTFYTPHVHNLGFLRTQAERIDPRLIEAWPRETKRDRSRFEKLKEAYVKARYSRHYRISAGADRHTKPDCPFKYFVGSSATNRRGKGLSSDCRVLRHPSRAPLRRWQRTHRSYRLRAAGGGASWGGGASANHPSEQVERRSVRHRVAQRTIWQRVCGDSEGPSRWDHFVQLAAKRSMEERLLEITFLMVAVDMVPAAQILIVTGGGGRMAERRRSSPRA